MQQVPRNRHVGDGVHPAAPARSLGVGTSGARCQSGCRWDVRLGEHRWLWKREIEPEPLLPPRILPPSALRLPLCREKASQGCSVLWEEASGALRQRQSAGTPGRRLPRRDRARPSRRAPSRQQPLIAAAASQKTWRGFGFLSEGKSIFNALSHHPHFLRLSTPATNDSPGAGSEAARRGRCWRCRWCPGEQNQAQIFGIVPSKEGYPGGKGSGKGDSSASPACPRPEERAGEASWKPRSREAGMRALVRSVCKQRCVGDEPGTLFTAGSPWARRQMLFGDG